MNARVQPHIFTNAQYRMNFTSELIVDLFAGGGGASTGLEIGLGRPVDIAINHNPLAVSMHMVNHPHAKHYTQDVFSVAPHEATGSMPVGWLHMSPDCTHHSQAKGGQPRSKEIRDLAWVGVKWAGMVRPRIISLENVHQMLKWGPLVAKRCKATGRVLKLDGAVAEPGERVPVEHQYLIPDAKRQGQTWAHFVRSLEVLGYTVEWRIIRACDYGAATRRRRLFMIARCDGQPIEWPAPTHHAKPASKKTPHWPWAAEHIDWKDTGVSIFLDKEEGRRQGVKRPLADATLRRIAKGVQREVLGRAQPFIVACNHGGSGFRGQAVDEPLCTITAARDAHGLVVPTLAPFLTEHANASSARVFAADEPLRTICANVKGGHFAAVTAFLAQANGGFNVVPSLPADSPLSTITVTGSQQQLVAAHMLHMRNNCHSQPADMPLHTASAGGQHHGIVECVLSKEQEAGALRVAAFLMQYYSEGGQWVRLDEPLATITTRDRLALVTVIVQGEPYVIVDIRMRMLKPRELYGCQGFPPEYVIDRGHDGKPLSIKAQTHMVGNSVSPHPMAALARANNPWADAQVQKAA